MTLPVPTMSVEKGAGPTKAAKKLCRLCKRRLNKETKGELCRGCITGKVGGGERVTLRGKVGAPKKAPADRVIRVPRGTPTELIDARRAYVVLCISVYVEDLLLIDSGAKRCRLSRSMYLRAAARHIEQHEIALRKEPHG